MIAAEEWKPVPGFPEYQASSLGRIASLKRGQFRILIGGKNDQGYRNVQLYSGGVRVMRRVHQLVALTFHGPRPEGLEVRHLDGNQLNNAASNLAYGTHAENMQDRLLHNPPVLATHCTKGHPLNEANVYRYPSESGRSCRTCKSACESASRRRRKLRAAGVAA